MTQVHIVCTDYWFLNHGICRPDLSVWHIWLKYIWYILVHKSWNHDLCTPGVSICHMWPKYIWAILVHKACKDNKYPTVVSVHIFEGTHGKICHMCEDAKLKWPWWLVGKVWKDDKCPVLVSSHIIYGGLWSYFNHSNCDVHSPLLPVSHKWTKCIQTWNSCSSQINDHLWFMGPNQFGLLDGSVSYYKPSIQFFQSSSNNIFYSCKQILDKITFIGQAKYEHELTSVQ